MFSFSQIVTDINLYINRLDYPAVAERLYQPVKYTMALGGKRVRPALALMAYNLYKENIENILSPAVAIEIYHSFTLLHDDIMDRSDMRRGNPTVYKTWGENAAILSGDAMQVLAYRYLSECEPALLGQVLRIFNEMALEICEGQQFDMEFETRDDVTEAEYLEMIRKKTAVLLAASLRIGAVLAGAPEEDIDHLADFGNAIGISFQLQDDLLDVYGDTTVFGKKIGGDILCNKKTFLLINALKRATDGQKEELLAWINGSDHVPEEKIEAVISLYDQIGVKQICTDAVNIYYDKAMQSLSKVGVAASAKRELENLVEQLMNRKL